jgi:hypothetical protein
MPRNCVLLSFRPKLADVSYMNELIYDLDTFFKTRGFEVLDMDCYFRVNHENPHSNLCRSGVRTRQNVRRKNKK